MKTVDKAFTVLDQFTLEQTEIGLNELARKAGLDKAATRRLLLSLAKHGFIEQSEETRKYRLGNGFLRLARIREATVPVRQAAQEVADWLIEQVGETVHVSLPGPTGMTTIAYRLPARGHIITIDPAEVLPYHATASGLAFLSLADPPERQRLLGLPRAAMTSQTVTDPAALLPLAEAFSTQGYSETHSTFEEDVASLAMPFFQGGTKPAGCIAIALPAGDMTPDRKEALLPLLKAAVAQLDAALAGG